MGDREPHSATSPPRAAEGPTEASLLLAVPGLARIAAAAWWRTTGWAAEASLRAGSRAVRAAIKGEPPAELFQATGAELREYARRLLEIVEAEDRGRGGEPESAAASPEGTATSSLRERGAELLRRSADVRYEEESHPAYARILGQLAADEGRILRLLALAGPQPSVDVRTGVLPINVGSELVAPGLTMIGAEAGCRSLDRVPAYLNNLYRLGLIWFSRESLPDPTRYQVLESQPDVIAALRQARRTRTVRRSIHLTPFGEDFCETCLPIDTADQ